ncbi:hypothetical protein N7495_002892 [Penicillium taxi]|uniref:uncharacterized protein n=1 Tax=Penicillium taxi TaxID=168475 RepID=UPI0025453CA7|nr:uncharacterized protein N7495_002892 [Penicillium taxi]KAJ5902364.1 hypothetical protein N7495_002892 [Penicillium taxi]
MNGLFSLRDLEMENCKAERLEFYALAERSIILEKPVAGLSGRSKASNTDSESGLFISEEVCLPHP